MASVKIELMMLNQHRMGFPWKRTTLRSNIRQLALRRVLKIVTSEIL